MGTPEFAVASLKELVDSGYNVVGVVTVPDKPAGRGKKLAQSEVKQYAVENDLKVLQPEKLKDPEFLADLKELNADLQVVVAFRMLPEAVWAMPRLGTFNLHGSLLPHYRGAAPLNWAVINGEQVTGVTTFLLDHKIDTGKILFKEKTPIGKNETVGIVHDRLMQIGARLVLKTVNAIAEGHVNPISQDEFIDEIQELKHAPKIFKEDCRVDWSQNAEKIRNLIRGLSPYPTAWTRFVNKVNGETIDVKLFYAEKEIEGTFKPGTVLSDGRSYLKITCKDGWLKITDLQLAGKKRMKTEEFLHGFKNPEIYFAE
ncbi:MAG: methionyl-tRNA formyltransferase [Prolixibacteraceae bacterium]|nr:methionyl-tRNA formyltransferase [Prolixibacteraceae bacterium]